MRQEQFVARHQAEWEAFEQWLQRRGDGPRRPRSAGTGAVPDEEMPARYRRLCQQLALARRRGYSPPLVERLQQLMQGGHAVLYRAPPPRWKRAWEFLFAGFPPPKSAARRTFLEEFANTRATLIFYEGASRVDDCLADMAVVFGGARQAAVCRELTKLYETCIRGSLDDLAADPRFTAPKGEIVILVGPGTEKVASADDAEAALREAMTRLPLGEAASEVAKALGLSRKDLYRQALALKDQA